MHVMWIKYIWNYQIAFIGEKEVQTRQEIGWMNGCFLLDEFRNDIEANQNQISLELHEIHCSVYVSGLIINFKQIFVIVMLTLLNLYAGFWSNLSN